MFVVFLILALAFPTLTFAVDPESTISANIQATVPSNAGPTSGDLTPPTIPILLRPVDGTYTNHPRPEFVWLISTDPNSNYTSNDLYLNHVATYLGVNNYGNSLTHNYTSRLEDGSLRLLPTSDLPDGTYDWYVIAYDLSGNTRGSATWHLTIDTIAPQLTLIQVGPHSHPNINVSGPLTLATGGTTSIILGSDPWSTLTLILIHEDLGTIYNHTQNSLLGGKATFSPDLFPGSYQVIASATDLAGNTTTLPVFTLLVAGTVPPSIPTSTSLPGGGEPSVSWQPLSSLPATLLLAATRVGSANLIVLMIAVSMLLLLITRRKYNLQLIDAHSNQPISHAMVTSNQKRSFTTNKRGNVYIKDLTARTELKVQVEDTVVTSLCVVKPSNGKTILSL